MANENNLKIQEIILGILLVLIVSGIAYYSKGRTGNNIPNTPVSDIKDNPSLSFPKDLGTKYITAVDWPPIVQVVDAPFDCDTTLSVPEGEKIRKVAVNNHTYCVDELTEGAAGSTYIQYGYMFPKDNNVTILAFTLKEVQCGNYNDPEKSVCEKERQNFNIDKFIDGIVFNPS